MHLPSSKYYREYTTLSNIRRITNLDGINDESFTIEQFGDIRIDQVSIRNSSGGFSQTGLTFDSNIIQFDNGEDYFIPEACI